MVARHVALRAASVVVITVSLVMVLDQRDTKVCWTEVLVILWSL